MQEWKQQTGLNVRDNKRVTLRLMKEVNRVKKMLSANKDAVLPVDCFQNDKDFTMRIDRRHLEEATKDVIVGINDPIIEAMEACKVDDIKLHSVEVVGGPSKIPCVQQSILETVQKYNTDIKSLSFTLNFSESVARGCALMVCFVLFCFALFVFIFENKCLHVLFLFVVCNDLTKLQSERI